MANRYIEKIKNAKNVAIYSHTNPDADALCSSFAIKEIFKLNFGIENIDVFIDGEIGDLYNPIINENVISLEKKDSYDVAFVLDCPSAKRLGAFENDLRNCKIIFNIDHHENNEMFGNFNCVATRCSSCCEIIERLARHLELETNDKIAKMLYQGILTDTNEFTSLTVSKRTHRSLSELLEKNFDENAIKQYYFNNSSREQMDLVARTLKSMKFFLDDTISVMFIDNKLLTKSKLKFEDTLGIVDNGLKINKTELSAIIIEKQPNVFYVSLRSRGKINAGEVARRFRGGGYLNIAAFQAKGNIDKIHKKLIDKIKLVIDKNHIDLSRKDEITF